MSDQLLLVIAAISLLPWVPLNWYVALRFGDEARIQPHIASLTGSALGRLSVAASATFSAIVAAHSVVFLLFDLRLLPAPWPTVLLYAALIVVSLPNLYFAPLIRRWRKRRLDGK